MILSYRPKCVWKLYLVRVQRCQAKTQQAINPLLKCWKQTIYHFKAKDVNSLFFYKGEGAEEKRKENVKTQIDYG